MSLQPGTTLGPYEVLDLIGRGGMGEVYRARDHRLDRLVAIKALPEAARFNQARVERFQRELRAISRLNHPHICSVYDVGTEGSLPYLVMELVDGRTLEERLGQGPMTIADAQTYAIQIADALDCAHRHGVTHRDLKPANVMISTTGVKILDFGIARIHEAPDDDAQEVNPGPGALTADDGVVGTPPYVAPEQLEGRNVGARADIFSLGVMLYEMLTGRRPFEGGSRATLIAAVLDREPAPLTDPAVSAPPTIPPLLERVVLKCLAKNPDDRWQTTRDLADELRWIAAGAAVSGGPRPDNSWRARWGTALALIAVVAVGAVLASLGASSPVELTRFAISPPTSHTLGSDVALSPDGRSLAFVVVDSAGSSRLVLRRFEALEPQILPDTVGAQQPFWSPDGQSIGFFADRALKVLSLTAQTAHRRAVVRQPFGATWGRNGTIVFAPERNGVLYTVPATGGPAALLTSFAAGETSHTRPRFLPDGRDFLFTATGGHHIAAASLDSPLHTTVMDADLMERSPAIVAGRYVVYVKGGTLVARWFDTRTKQVAGDSMPLGERLTAGATGTTTGAWFDATPTTLAVMRPAVAGREFAWVDRGGQLLEVIAGSTDLANPDLSRDGNRLSAMRVETDLGRRTIQLLDLTAGTAIELGAGVFPALSPDGMSVAYSARQNNEQTPSLYLRHLNRDPPELLASNVSRTNANVHGWSPDGRHLLYASLDEKTNWDIWALPVTGDRRPHALVRTAASEAWPAVSPNGRWLAYASDETGDYEIYVQRFPDGGDRRQISQEGGSQPRWRVDGTELFYLRPASRGDELVAVTVKAATDFSFGDQRVLFRPELSTSSLRTTYLPSPDGRRFLIVRPRPSDTPPGIEIVLNWQSLLPR